MFRTFFDYNEFPGWKPLAPRYGWDFRHDSGESFLPVPFGEGRAEDGLKLRFSLPAVMEKDFHVSVLGNRLTISGERKEPEGFGSVAFYGLSYGHFEKSVMLPPGLDMENMKARFHHGVLDIHIPYLTKTKAREIPVMVGEEMEMAMAAAS